MTLRSADTHLAVVEHRNATPSKPRFDGMLRRLSGLTNQFALPMAGKRWNPIFAVVEHRGRRTGRQYATPVAARRIAGGFAISLAFGAHVDWYQNLLAARGGTIRWRADTYRVTTPERIDVTTGLAAFHPVQRLFLRIGGIHGYIQVRDLDSGDR